jgi:hypothetical protein
MDLKRFELISLVDVDFRAAELNNGDLSKIGAIAQRNGPLLEALTSSFGWVFNWESENQNSLPGTQRFSLTSLAQQNRLRDASILVAPEFGVGVICLHHLSDGIVDLNQAEQRKREANAEGWRVAESILRSLRIASNEIERQYPIVGLELNGTLDEFLLQRQNKLQIAQLYTGNFEQEREANLLQYIESGDLSRRSYERLYLRWTDALAVYDRRVGADFDAAFFRCVLLYETCVLTRRMLRSAIQRMDKLYVSMSILPRPLAFNRLTTSLARLRADLVLSPPVQSDEAHRLLTGAYEGSGVYRLAETAAERSKLLESRFQWAKAQVLGVVAVLTYLAEKLGFFDWVKRLF